MKLYRLIKQNKEGIKEVEKRYYPDYTREPIISTKTIYFLVDVIDQLRVWKLYKIADWLKGLVRGVGYHVSDRQNPMLVKIYGLEEGLHIIFGKDFPTVIQGFVIYNGLFIELNRNTYLLEEKIQNNRHVQSLVNFLREKNERRNT